MSRLSLRRATTRVTVVVAALAFLLLPGTVAAGTPSAIIFNARDDFRTSPNQANPSGPWSYRQKTPHGRPLLAVFTTNQYGIPGLEAWLGTEIIGPTERQPSIGVNTSGTDQVINSTTLWPAGALLVHPNIQAGAAIILWRSPLEGKVNIRATLIDRDGTCGEDGFSWSIRRAAHESPLASGLAPNGSSVKVSLAAVPVMQGTGIELRVGTGPGGQSCDATEVRFRIALTPY